MPTPTEHKPVQARILKYAEAIGGTAVSQMEADQRHVFAPDMQPVNRAKDRTLIHELMTAKTRVPGISLSQL